MSTYTPASPTTVEGFMLQPESRVLVGSEYLYGSLAGGFTSYSAYVGMQAGKFTDLGALASLSFSHVPTFEAVESANISDSNIWVLSGEETTVSVGLRQFTPEVLDKALGTGVLYNVGTESVLTFGGKCDIKSRPLAIEFTNAACAAPTAEDISNGISGGILTLYDTFVSSGLPWDDINAGVLNELALEFQVRPVIAHARGNRLGNLYLY